MQDESFAAKAEILELNDDALSLVAGGEDYVDPDAGADSYRVRGTSGGF